ncbi:hypothetical protein AS189_18945 [Arthrobacter alpinus]|uniref:Uncharacterized protein n=1 Tax=Arthrobacter alpinus TaxID=656366 RepID=A0A0S2M350_9MICC|nr:hypothetical protein [Arthrobacter alpinus]ALO68197.1 hypothetical protein AS189_18945 [Arthrobacter alpinus]
MAGRNRRRPFTADTWHVQLPAELAAELSAREASSSAGNMATARHLRGPRNLAARKANELESH